MSEPEAIAEAKERLQYVDCDAMVGFVEDIFVAQDVRTWAKVLSENNPRCEDMIKAVIDYAPKCRIGEAVGCCIDAFVAEDLQEELVDLLSNMILRGTEEHHRHKTVQNLLLIALSNLANEEAAREGTKAMLMKKIRALNSYDWKDLAEMMTEIDLFEEAFVVYNKFKDTKSALSVLLHHMKDIERAKDYACFCESDEVWDMIKACEDGAGNQSV